MLREVDFLEFSVPLARSPKALVMLMAVDTEEKCCITYTKGIVSEHELRDKENIKGSNSLYMLSIVENL